MDLILCITDHPHNPQLPYRATFITMVEIPLVAG
jgi:hypothetical protein